VLSAVKIHGKLTNDFHYLPYLASLPPPSAVMDGGGKMAD